MYSRRRVRLLRLTICVLFLLTTDSFRSQQVQTNTPPPAIEVTTTLVEVDAVVTDSKGRPVTNLAASDFQILQDGKPQRITTFSHISTTTPIRAPGNSAPGGAAARPLIREEVKRTIAFVIDDLRLDWQAGYRTIASLRRKLPKVFSSTLREGDLVGLFYLSRRQGFEQYTTDLELLKTLADGLKFLPGGMQRSELKDDAEDSPIEFARQSDAERMEELSLRGLGSIVDEMRGMPGRKSVILLSTAISTPQNLSRLIDQAQNAGITFYPVDPRENETALLTINLNEPLSGDPSKPEEQRKPQPAPGRETLDALTKNKLASSLTALAKQTGGEGWGREFDLDQRLIGALQDQESYYLIGYVPDDSSFDRKKHSIEVRLTNKDLRVRSSRSQFNGQQNTGAPQTKTSGDVMSDLLSSPYKNSGVRLMLSTFFTAESGKSTLNSAVFVDGRDLHPERTAEGKFRGGVELRAVAIDPKGNRSNEVGRIARFELDEAAWRRVQETGAVFRLPSTGGNPGPYQIRLALRDIVSGATGTASTFLIVPDAKKGELTLSDVLLSVPANVANPHPLSNLAARSFVRGRDMEWTAEVYNAKPGDKKSDSTPKVLTSTRLYRGADLVRETPFAAAVLRKIEGRTDFVARGIVGTSDLVPGEYVLQLLVRDQNGKTSRVSRFADFRIIEAPLQGVLR
jgi:VWFA-related protein